jgi:hypothetical protein
MLKKTSGFSLLFFTILFISISFCGVITDKVLADPSFLTTNPFLTTNTDNSTNRQITTGPIPPSNVPPLLTFQGPTIQGGAQSTISVPAYLWHDGCAPTSVGMVIGYYDSWGLPDLIKGDAKTQTDSVNQAIASHGTSLNPRHYEDYALPIDSKTTGVLTDRSVLPEQNRHTNDSIADFMRTSWSSAKHLYGWSSFNDVGPAFVSYIKMIYPNLSPTYNNYYMGNNYLGSILTWSIITNEIDNKRPMGLLVDSDADGYTDHFVTVVGYRDNPSQQVGCYDTWYRSIRWIDFMSMAEGRSFGIYGATSFFSGYFGPAVTNSSGASNITDTSARLNCEVTATGGESPTIHIFWGKSDGSTSPTSWAYDINLGARDVGTFYSDISGLTAGTTYYYRCYATNSAGGSWAGSSSSFTTKVPLTFSYSVSDDIGASSSPMLSYTNAGLSKIEAITTLPQIYLADVDTFWSITNPLPQSTLSERWQSNQAISGKTSSPITINFIFYHQFALAVGYQIVGGDTPSAPTLTSTAFGAPLSQVLTPHPQELWLDNGAAYALPNPLLGSTSTERWQSNSATSGSISSNQDISVFYNHQYYVIFKWNPAESGYLSVASDWFNSGATLQAVASANPGWQFESWNGSGEGSLTQTSNNLSMSINSPLVETAIFYPSITITTPNKISVSYSWGTTKGSIPEGTTQTFFAPLGTEISLTARPTLFLYSFAGWTGVNTSTNSDILVVLDSPQNLSVSYSYNLISIGGIVAVSAIAITVLLIYIYRRKRPKSQQK